ALDEHDDDDLGIARGRERGEPRVVLSLLRFRVGDGLRGARLADDVEARDARGCTGAIGRVHDRPHALPQEGPHGGVELDVAIDAAGVAPHHAALRPRDTLHDARLPEDPAVGDGRHEARDLHRRHQQLPLADRHVHGLAGVPHRRLASARRRWPRKQSELFGAELNTRGGAEAERGAILHDGGSADLEAGAVEKDVARVGDGGHQIDAAVALRLPVAEHPAAEWKLALAVHAVGGRERSFLQPGRSEHHLEDRARRVLALDRAVEQREVRILHDAQPRVAVDGAGEAVDLEGGRRGHREDGAVARVHHRDRAPFAFHELPGDFRYAGIHGGDDLRAGMRLGGLHEPHGPAHRVHLDPLAAILTAQELVEETYEPRLPDHVATTITTLLELIVVGLADIAEQVRGETARRIHALRLD